MLQWSSIKKNLKEFDSIKKSNIIFFHPPVSSHLYAECSTNVIDINGLKINRNAEQKVYMEIYWRGGPDFILSEFILLFLFLIESDRIFGAVCMWKQCVCFVYWICKLRMFVVLMDPNDYCIINVIQAYEKLFGRFCI